MPRCILWVHLRFFVTLCIQSIRTLRPRSTVESRFNLCVAALIVVVYSTGSTLAAETGNLYRMQAGDTLVEIAEVYLGGREFVPELLEFNNIKNSTAVREGTLIALPGKIRDEAIERMRAAEKALAIALESQADRYAARQYNDAKRSLQVTKKFRFKAAYAKVLGLAERTMVMAKEAKRIADENANVAKDGRVSEVFGNVQISEDGGQSWRSVVARDPLPLAAIVRTDSESRAEVVLEDGSIFQVLEASELSIAQFLRDRRSGKINAELRVLMGDIMGDIKPKTRDDSHIEIKTGKASIAVRGTRLRVKVDDKGVTRTELLSGDVDLHAGGRTVPIPPNYGVVAPPNRKPRKPTKLLPPPKSKELWRHDVTTARQILHLQWEKVKSKRLRQYHVEIAKDIDFNQIVQNELVKGEGLQSKLLPEGDYVWRVSSMDKSKLEGKSTDPHVLTIRKHLDVALEYKGTLVEVGSEFFGSTNNIYRVRSSADNTSVVRLEYSIDGSDYQATDGEIRLPGGAERVLRVRGVGLEGDAGSEQQIRLFVDDQPPELDMEVSHPIDEGEDVGTWVHARINMADDSGIQKVWYSLDGKPFQNYVEPIRLSTLQNYTITVRAKDVIGNVTPNVSFDFNGEVVPRGEQFNPLRYRIRM